MTDRNEKKEQAPARLRPGGLEEATLRAVLHLAGKGYGVNIKAEVEAAMEKELTFGPVYTTLDRLEKKGFVEASWGEATPERGGKPKQLFKITGAGQFALDEAQRQQMAMWERLPATA